MPLALKWPLQWGGVSSAWLPELGWPWPILLRKPREPTCWPLRTPAASFSPAAGRSSGSSAKADPATATANSPAQSAWYNLVIVVHSGDGRSYESVQSHTLQSRSNHSGRRVLLRLPLHPDYWQYCAGTIICVVAGKSYQPL